MYPDDQTDMAAICQLMLQFGARTGADLNRRIAAFLAGIGSAYAPIIAQLRESANWYYPPRPPHIHRRLHGRPRGRKRTRGRRKK